jgi:hypothetical protein
MRVSTAPHVRHDPQARAPSPHAPPPAPRPGTEGLPRALHSDIRMDG